MPRAALDLAGYDSFHFVVEDLERSRRFYVERLGFREIARAGDALTRQSGQQSIVFGAGEARVCVSTPLSERSKAARYLARHPAGVMSLSLRVESLDGAMAYLEAHGGTFLNDPVEDVEPSGGRYRAVEIATPVGDVAFRFVERGDYAAFAPGFVDGGVRDMAHAANEFGIDRIDHVTFNGLTMQPIVAFHRDVLGLRPFWEVAFHTDDAARGAVGPREGERGLAEEFARGSGLKSIVMWDPASGVKFATNEPLRPHFRDSQIYRFVDDNGGAGVQHVAFRVADIVRAVAELGGRGVEFVETPPEYYRKLPERLAALGIHHVKEELSLLEKQQILLDGSHDRYMLQIFLREARKVHSDERAGPFFYEIIQRCGDQGFGYGNFRALFESIERVQTGQGEHR